MDEEKHCACFKTLCLHPDYASSHIDKIFVNKHAHRMLSSSILCVRLPMTICDRLWEKVRCRAYFQNRVIGTTGLSKLSAIKCTTRSVVKVTCCGVMTVSIQSFLFTQRSKSSRKR